MKSLYQKAIASVLAALVSAYVAAPSLAQDCDRCVVNNYLQSALLYELEHHAALQLHYDYRHTMLTGSSDTPDAADEKIATTLVNLYYSHNILEETNLDINLPVVSQAYTERPNYTYDSGRDTSLGDLSLLLTFRPFFGVKDDKLVDWRIRAGVKLPTGDSGELKNYPNTNSLPRPGDPVYPTSAVHPYDRALGSGSTDWIVGSSYVVRYEEFFGVLDGQFIGRTTGENDFKFGDTITAHAMPGYIFSQTRGNEFSILMDASYRYSAQSSYDGQTVDDSGQTAFTLGPQLMANFQKQTIVSIGIDIPLYQSVEGTQLASDYEILAAVMTGF